MFVALLSILVLVVASHRAVPNTVVGETFTFVFVLLAEIPFLFVSSVFHYSWSPVEQGTDKKRKGWMGVWTDDSVGEGHQRKL